MINRLTQYLNLDGEEGDPLIDRSIDGHQEWVRKLVIKIMGRMSEGNTRGRALSSEERDASQIIEVALESLGTKDLEFLNDLSDDEVRLPLWEFFRLNSGRLEMPTAKELAQAIQHEVQKRRPAEQEEDEELPYWWK